MTLDEIRAALWATPNTMDGMKERSYEAMKRQATNGGRKGRSHPGNLREQVSPLMCQAYQEAMIENSKTPPTLWATPTANDHKGSGPTVIRKDGKDRTWDRLDSATEQGIGQTQNGSPAQTEKRGSLNPAFPCWLMGIPSAWLLSMRRAMQSYRK